MVSPSTVARAFPPGPPPRGLRGTLRYYVGMVRDPLGFVAARFERYGHTYFVPGPGGGLYVSRHPDHIRDVLVTHAS